MITVFYGPDKEFAKIIPPKIRPKTLTQLLEESDINSRKIIVTDNSGDKIKPPKSNISNLTIKSHEYSRLSDSGLNGFITIFNKYRIENMYVQNPPNIILSQLRDFYDKIEIIEHNYRSIENNDVNKFFNSYDDVIFGQTKAKDKILLQIYQLSKKYNKNKPLVLLFYGPTGVGKTETAKFLSDLMGENLFRKQFSMYQNIEFANYVFGGKHTEACLARDLLERESNVILFDEFDKANNLFYSAFYQMFDEGVFEDKHYKVNLKNSIIICTSNFLNINDVKNTLGNAIYSRIDCVVEFKPLDNEAAEKLIKLTFDEIYSELVDDDKNIIKKEEMLSTLLPYSKELYNARQINKLVRDFVLTYITNKIFN